MLCWTFTVSAKQTHKTAVHSEPALHTMPADGVAFSGNHLILRPLSCPRRAVLCRAVLCCAMLCYHALCCAVPYCATMPFPMQCCAVPCCYALCSAELCCAELCCPVLCSAVLCCAVVCCAVLWCAEVTRYFSSSHQQPVQPVKFKLLVVA